IVAVLIGGTLAGFAGALLALPAAAIIKVILQRVYLHERLAVVQREDEEHAAANAGSKPTG
ncbi:MAG TPA: AI-2E family transporter, partial [Actinomycetota bacterium]|nr:AI-2E family transporter [Actinomycetota bacterium]